MPVGASEASDAIDYMMGLMHGLPRRCAGQRSAILA
jgi:hypothetical protein